MKDKTSICAILLIMMMVLSNPLFASEVLPETDSQVIVREHPKTGKPYVAITSGAFRAQPFFRNAQKFSRPDYRLLDPRTKSGEIPYDGPYSDSKRIYIFAATLATLGTVGGAVGMAVIPASASGAAATGGAGYLAAGSAVAGGTVAAAVAGTQSDPEKDDFTQASESKSTALSNLRN